jgi:hypothetical protein
MWILAHHFNGSRGPNSGPLPLVTLLTDFSPRFKNYLFRDFLVSHGGTGIKNVIIRDVTPYDLLQINDVSGARDASIFRVKDGGGVFLRNVDEFLLN